MQAAQNEMGGMNRRMGPGAHADDGLNRLDPNTNPLLLFLQVLGFSRDMIFLES